MPKVYRWKVSGSAAKGQTWEVEGTAICEFHDVFDGLMEQCFDKLTKGRAVFGHPGKGCSGPYDVSRVSIEQVQQ